MTWAPAVFFQGRANGEPKAEAGCGSWEWLSAPSDQLGDLGECCKFLQQGPGQSPEASRFQYNF